MVSSIKIALQPLYLSTKWDVSSYSRYIILCSFSRSMYTCLRHPMKRTWNWLFISLYSIATFLLEKRISCSNFIRQSSTGTHMILHKGWPNSIINILQNVCECWNVWHDLHVTENLSFMGECLVGPNSKRKDILKLIHNGHLRVEKCKVFGYAAAMHELMMTLKKKLYLCQV